MLLTQTLYSIFFKLSYQALEIFGTYIFDQQFYMKLLCVVNDETGSKFTENSKSFIDIKDKVKLSFKPTQQAKPSTYDLTNNRIVSIISQKRKEMAKHKPLFSSNAGKDMEQPQCIYLNERPIQNVRLQEGEEKNDYLLQTMKNEIYLKKKKSLHTPIKSDGISMLNPKNSWIHEQNNQQQENQGLNKFTNIVIKRLQNKCRKVSFSQFIQDKKQRDYLTRFKYSSSKNKTSKQSMKKQHHAVDRKQLNGILNKHCQHHIPFKNFNHQCKSVILTENRKATSKARVYSKMHDRYHSISDLNESFAMNISLQISKIHQNR